MNSNGLQSDDPALFKAIVEQCGDAIIYADRDGVVRVWNRGAEAVFGYSAAEVIGGSLDVIIPERFRKAHWAAYRRAIDAGRPSQGDSVRTTKSMHKLGHELYVDISFGILKSDAGVVLGSLAMGRDCTARYRAEKALRERLAQREAPAP